MQKILRNLHKLPELVRKPIKVVNYAIYRAKRAKQRKDGLRKSRAVNGLKSERVQKMVVEGIVGQKPKNWKEGDGIYPWLLWFLSAI